MSTAELTQTYEDAYEFFYEMIESSVEVQEIDFWEGDPSIPNGTHSGKFLELKSNTIQMKTPDNDGYTSMIPWYIRGETDGLKWKATLDLDATNKSFIVYDVDPV